MIDIKLIRQDPSRYKKACQDKHFEADIDQLLDIDQQLKIAKQKLQDLATDKNTIGKSISRLALDEKQQALSQLAALKKQEASLDAQIKECQPIFDEIMMQVAAPCDIDVPVGKDDTENLELRKEGQIREFDFAPKDHMQLGLDLDIIDVPRGVKVAGSRNYFLKGDGALLHWAILRFSMDYMVDKGYTPMSVPILAKDEIMRGTGYFPGAEEQTYQMERDSLSLVGTAEVPLTAYYSGEILPIEQLPIKLVGMSSCFRREAGAAGKDTHGLYRVHQFDKVEQVIICQNDNDLSQQFHDEILANSEAILRALELPYKVVTVCTGDIGRGQAKKYDIETWMPSRDAYCETHSASKFYDFQSRRMNLRYKDAKSKSNLFCHSLNNTVIASPRILIPVLETHQNSDGSITIPQLLRPYMNGKEKITKQ